MPSDPASPVQELIDQLRQYAEMLDRAPVFEHFDLSMTHTYSADTMRDAASRLEALTLERDAALIDAATEAAERQAIGHHVADRPEATVYLQVEALVQEHAQLREARDTAERQCAEEQRLAAEQERRAMRAEEARDTLQREVEQLRKAILWDLLAAKPGPDASPEDRIDWAIRWMAAGDVSGVLEPR